jgi:hypothetical protein
MDPLVIVSIIVAVMVVYIVLYFLFGCYCCRPSRYQSDQDIRQKENHQSDQDIRQEQVGYAEDHYHQEATSLSEKVIRPKKINHSKQKKALKSLKRSPVKAVYVAYRKSDQNLYDIIARVHDAVDSGYNLIVLPFWISPSFNEGQGFDSWSGAGRFDLLSSAEKIALINYVHSKGVAMILGVAGSTYGTAATDYPSNGAAEYGSLAARLAIDMGLDGLDFNFENFGENFTTLSGLNRSETIQWIYDANQAARSLLNEGNHIITHGPEAVYFGLRNNFGKAGYIDLLKTNVNIDYLLIQYYNDGNIYNTFVKLFISNSIQPGTTIGEIISRLGSSYKNKLIIGKPTTNADAGSGYVDPFILGDIFEEARNSYSAYHWDSGLSCWQYTAPGEGGPNSRQFIDAVYY